jgi:geranylgeranyl pyrophosphate synthase
MDTQLFENELLTLPEAAGWPEMATIFRRTGNTPRLDWELPGYASRAIGADDSLAAVSGAAIACLQISIILVDDILDADPRGEYHKIGAGRASNLALAFQSAAFRLIERAPVSAENKAAAIASLAWAAHATALGQDLDVQNLRGEENYWKVIRAKSTPFYGAAFEVGALLAGSSTSVARGLRDIGILLGEIIQLHDDLVDAMESPANPDWTEGRNNLMVLYARTANHPERTRLESLLPRVDDPQALREAQQILIQCGAVSYCAYQLYLRHREAKQLLSKLPLANPQPIADVMAGHTQPLVMMLRSTGASIPVGLSEVAA